MTDPVETFMQLPPLMPKHIERRTKAFKAQKPIGFWERWGRKTAGYEAIPFVGGFITAQKTDAIRRYVEHHKIERDFPGGFDEKGYRAVSPYAMNPQQYFDDETVYLDWVEDQERGYSIGGKIATGIQESVPWMAEYMMTAGLTGTGKIAELATRKALGVALKAAVIRTPLMAGRIKARAAQDLLSQELHITDQGRLVLEDLEAGAPAKAALKATFQVFLANVSEEMGDLLIRGLSKFPIAGPAARKTFSALSKRAPKFAKVFAGKVAPVARMAGWNSMLGETLEETLERVLNASLGLETMPAGALAERSEEYFTNILNALVQSPENALVELGVLSFGGTLYAPANYYHNHQYDQNIKSAIEENPLTKDWGEGEKKELAERIKSDVRSLPNEDTGEIEEMSREAFGEKAKRLYLKGLEGPQAEQALAAIDFRAMVEEVQQNWAPGTWYKERIYDVIKGIEGVEPKTAEEIIASFSQRDHEEVKKELQRSLARGVEPVMGFEVQDVAPPSMETDVHDVKLDSFKATPFGYMMAVVRPTPTAESEARLAQGMTFGVAYRIYGLEPAAMTVLKEQEKVSLTDLTDAEQNLWLERIDVTAEGKIRQAQVEAPAVARWNAVRLELLGTQYEEAMWLGAHNAIMGNDIPAPETPEWKEWFKGSQVLENFDPSTGKAPFGGIPLVLWHGSHSFNMLEHQAFTQGHPGIHLGTQATARQFAKDLDHLYPFYVRLLNPLKVPDMGSWGYSQLRGFLVDKGFVTSEELEAQNDIIVARVAQAQGSFLYTSALNRERMAWGEYFFDVLEAQGHDGAWYINDHEERGTVSWLVPLKTANNIIKWAHNIKPSIDKPNVLKQGLKGRVSFLASDGRALLEAFAGADVTTLMHEMFHVWRRGLDEGQEAVLRKSFNIEGAWTEKAEENAARAFERWLHQGSTDIQELKETFKSFQQWFQKAYGRVERKSKGPLPFAISAEARELFNDMFRAQHPTVEGRDARTKELKALIEKVEGEIEAAEKVEGFEGTQRVREAYEKLSAYEWELEEIENFQEPQAREASLEAGEDAANVFNQLDEAMVSDPKAPKESEKDFYKKIGLWEAMTSWTRGLWQRDVSLKRSPSGQQALQHLINAYVYLHSTEGRFSGKIRKAYAKLSSKEKKWLADTEGGTTSNYRMLIEDELPDPAVPKGFSEESIKEWIAVTREVTRYLWNEGIKAGMVRFEKRGVLQPLKPIHVGRLLRAMTLPGREMLMYERSAEGKTLRRVILDHPLNSDMSEAYLEHFIRRAHEGLTRKLVGALEYARKIPWVPDVITHEGREIAFLHTDPYMLLTRTLSEQALRIGIVQEFGQGLLRAATIQQMSHIAKVLKVSPRMNKEKLKERLEDAGMGADLVEGQTMKDLRLIAKLVDVPRGNTSQDYIESILSVQSLEGFTKVELRKLRSAVRKLGGVDLELKGQELLWALHDRVSTMIEDKLNYLRKQYQREGGDPKQYDDLLKVAQGLPLQRTSTRAWRAWRPLGAIIGAAHVSQAAIPNLTQQINIVPAYTGYVNLVKANGRLIADRKGVEDQIEALGAMKVRVFKSSFEKGFKIDEISRMIRDVSSRVTLLSQMLQRNEAVTGEAFRLLAEDWMKFGIKSFDEWKAKDLDLTDVQIQNINDGKMEASDATYSQIVQRGVAITQYTTEARYRQGRVTTHPLAREFFPYMSYTMGNMRNTMKLAKELYEGAKGIRENPARFLNAMRRTFTMASRYAFSGWLIIMIKRAISAALGKPPEEKEEGIQLGPLALDDLFDGLLQTQILGPAHRMMPWGDVRDPDILSVATTTMPKVRAIADVIAMGLSQLPDFPKWGPYGQFPLKEQLQKTAQRHFGVYRTIWRNYENFAYPALENYFLTRQRVSKWRREQRELEGEEDLLGVYQKQPRYFYVAREVARNDPAAAREELHRLLGDTKGAKRGKLFDGLRSSLSNRRPMNLSSQNMFKFLRSLLLEARAETLKEQRRYVKLMNEIAPKDERRPPYFRPFKPYKPRPSY